MTKATTNSELSLRKEPRASTKILDIIPSGTSVTILNSTEIQQKKWSQVDCGENIGWVPTSGLSIEAKSSKPKLDTSELDVEAKAQTLIENIQSNNKEVEELDQEKDTEETPIYKAKKKK